MAGSGRKTFTAGAVLSAADVQNYLQDQAVMVFAGTAARASAIASPTEGMLVYIKDVDQVQAYNGTTWIPQAYAQAAGTGATTTGVLTSQTSTTVNITYPTSRFTVAPIVSVWTSSPRYVATVGTNTAGSAVATVFNVSGASGTDATVYWSAVQMTSGTAAG
jgi:hypothetical protein